jgi:hypothetical protein
LQDWIQVAEHDNRNGELDSLNESESSGQGHTLLERSRGRPLDSHPIRQRIAEGNTDLDEVGDLPSRL